MLAIIAGAALIGIGLIYLNKAMECRTDQALGFAILSWVLGFAGFLLWVYPFFL